MTKAFVAEHEKIRQIAADLCRLVSTSAPCDTDMLAAARWNLGSAIMRNLSAEERQIYSKLARCRDDEASSLASRSQAELHEVFDAYNRHVDLWPTSAAGNNWASYRASVLSLIARLIKRMDWEESELFPFVERQALLKAQEKIVDRNWSRDAFAIKDQIQS